MLIQLIVSMFGIAFVHRNLSLLEKMEVISRAKLNSTFCFLQLPFYFYLIFKELQPVILIYIGIFFVTLILFEKIIGYFREKTFEKIHLHIIERLILLLKSGKSAQTSIKNVFENLTSWQKATFTQINEIFEINSRKNYRNNHKREFQQLYFQELDVILRSTNNVVEQLTAFRKALRLYNGLRHRSRQAIQPCRAQALVSIFIYLAFILLSKNYLSLDLISLPMLSSVVLFSAGQLIIFKLGGRIRWKT